MEEAPFTAKKAYCFFMAGGREAEVAVKMKILYKCRKYCWRKFFENNDDRIEAYYLELDMEELNEELKQLLKNQERQMEHQIEKFNKLYIIVGKSKEFAFYVPHEYGPYWPSSGHWDMSDNFMGMYGIKINSINDLGNIKKNVLIHSIEYLEKDYGIFGYLKEFNSGRYGYECFKSAIAESYIYHYLIEQEQIPNISEEENNYAFTVNDDRVLIKTNATKIDNGYIWYNNSCWKKNEELNNNKWDILYYVQIDRDEKKYNTSDIYKIPYENFHENKNLINSILEKSAWYIPVEMDLNSNWLRKYKINNNSLK